jgi:tRNA(adenine34) deaminase
MHDQDESYMREALALARRAAQEAEVPIGALVVSPYGETIGKGYNRVEHCRCQAYHAETRAIMQATRKRNDWRLDGCTLYVTLEPCMMCVSLCALSRIERIVYGAESPLFGYRLDKEGVLALYTKQIKNITGKVLAEEAGQLLKNFFNQKRGNRGEQ